MDSEAREQIREKIRLLEFEPDNLSRLQPEPARDRSVVGLRTFQNG
jgi:hypothetical protein